MPQRSWVLVFCAAAGLSACVSRAAEPAPEWMSLPVCDTPVIGVDTATAKKPEAELIAATILELGWIPAADSPAVVVVDPLPRLRNEGEVERALARHYPVHLRDQGISGSMTYHALVDPDGQVVNTSLYVGSGYPAFHQAGVRVLESMKFDPAVHDGCRTWLWLKFDVTFEVQ